jgi:AcrR family transcriptional regulator
MPRKPAGQNRSTRERLMDAALRLVAERGFGAATVGAIEEEAGLAPRSGALYQYFAGKDDALRCAIERELRVLDELGSIIEMLPLGDLRAELTLMARWNLSSLRRRANLIKLLQRETRQLPPDLLEEIYVRTVARPYDQVAAWLRDRLPSNSDADVYTLALVLIESMASYNAIRLTFGRTPDDIDDERFIAGWADIALAAANRYGLGDRVH